MADRLYVDLERSRLALGRHKRCLKNSNALCRKWQLTAVRYGEADGREAVTAVPWTTFRDEIIVLCLRWYLRYPLSYRNFEEMMAERGLASTTPQSPAGCSGMRRSSMSALDQRCAGRTGHGGAMRRTSVWQVIGRICIALSNQPATPSIYCSHRAGISLPPEHFCSLRWRRPGASSRES